MPRCSVPPYLDGVPALHGPDLAQVVSGQVRPQELDNRLDTVRVLLLVNVTYEENQGNVPGLVSTATGKTTR